MHIAVNLPHEASVSPRLPEKQFYLPGPDGKLPAHQSLCRVLKLLSSVNIRLSLFSFETLPGAMARGSLFSAVERAVDDTGLAFELNDGRVGALVYGWRPPNAEDSWVEDRTLARLDWALGGPLSSAELIDVYAVHRWSSEVADGHNAAALLSLGEPVRRVRHFLVA